MQQISVHFSKKNNVISDPRIRKEKCGVIPLTSCMNTSDTSHFCCLCSASSPELMLCSVLWISRIYTSCCTL